ARLLLQHALGLPHEEVIARSEECLQNGALAAYNSLIEKRSSRQPVSQLTGRREFWGLEFAVTAATLDPRPDSETLIEAALSHFPDKNAPLAGLDLGTGAGCLLIAVLSEYGRAQGLGVDASEAALAAA